jgi:hypothetical protein
MFELYKQDHTRVLVKGKIKQQSPAPLALQNKTRNGEKLLLVSPSKASRSIR